MKTILEETYNLGEGTKSTLNNILKECFKIGVHVVRDKATGLRYELWFPLNFKEYK